MPLQLRENSSIRCTSHSVRSGSWPIRNCDISASMIVRIVGRVGPGASPTPTTPSSVWISTTSPDADSRVPPGHLSGSRIGVRTAVVWMLVILTEDRYTRPTLRDCQPFGYCQQSQVMRATDRG